MGAWHYQLKEPIFIILVVYPMHKFNSLRNVQTEDGRIVYLRLDATLLLNDRNPAPVREKNYFQSFLTSATD